MMESVATTTTEAQPSRTTSTPAGALIGLLAGGVAVGAGQLVAALFRPAAAPVIAVGNRLLGLLGVYCSQTTAAHRPTDAVPSVLGALAGMYALSLLVAAAERPADPASEEGTNRRGFLTAALATAGAALVAGFGGKLLQGRRFNAEAARARIVLPPAA